jgi:hypothetical protein
MIACICDIIKHIATKNFIWEQNVIFGVLTIFAICSSLNIINYYVAKTGKQSFISGILSITLIFSFVFYIVTFEF